MKLMFLSVVAALIGHVSAEPTPLTEADDERRKIAAELVAVLVIPMDEEKFRADLAAKTEDVITQLKLKGESAGKVRKIMNDAGKKVTNETLVAMSRDAYAETYSVEQLTGILAFYKSDAGKAFFARTKNCDALIEEKQRDLLKSMLAQSAKELNQQVPGLLKKGAEPSPVDPLQIR